MSAEHTIDVGSYENDPILFLFNSGNTFITASIADVGFGITLFIDDLPRA